MISLSAYALLSMVCVVTVDGVTQRIRESDNSSSLQGFSPSNTSIWLESVPNP